MVLGRAIVRDGSAPSDAARRLALLNLMVTIGPGLAPLIGGALTAALGWRSVLFALCALGIVNLVAAWRLLPETRHDTSPADIATLARHYRQLLVSPSFLGYAVGGGCATTAMYAFIASAPFILTQQMGRSTHEVGIYLAVVISGVWLGSIVTSRLIATMPLDRLLVRGSALSTVAALIFLGGALSDKLTPVLVAGTMFAFTFGAGMTAPSALTKAVSVNPHVIGSASGLYGFAQMAVGALCTALVGIGDDPAMAAGLVLAGAGIVSQIAFSIALRPVKPAARG